MSSRITVSSFFTFPRVFVDLSTKVLSEPEAAMSPTSILETRPFSPLGNPFISLWSPKKPFLQTPTENRHHHPWDSGDTGSVGLGIVDALNKNITNTNPCKTERRRVLFGSELKVQLPPINPNSISSAWKSLASPRLFTGCFSPREMELSEDYTCVISHGPKPRTTHIFDNCIVGADFIAPRKENGLSLKVDFLSFCHACKKELGQGKDIFMYRGEKAFCSHECRQQEMLSDEGMEKFSQHLCKPTSRGVPLRSEEILNQPLVSVFQFCFVNSNGL